MKSYKIACIQMDVAPKSEQYNLKKALKMIDESVGCGAKIVCLPELFTTGFDFQYIRRCARIIPNKITNELSKKAKKLKIFIISGSLPIIDGDRLYNTSLLFDPNGRIVGKYNKIHLFPLMGEDKYFNYGEEYRTYKTEFGNFGIIICYDIRFPELTRSLTLLGAEIIFVPSQFPSQRLDHWKTLVRARAIENQIFVVAVNRVGEDSKNSFCGNSMVVDPWGEVLTSKNEKEGIIVTSVNLDIIYDVRERLPCLPNINNGIDR